ncbi:MAG: metalloregulator ArsR/SmtB family transcription factor [Clostridiales bacterium]|jgi:DNA-binding transcriptional ArsR family regulator|nr:metalloregulator ArsR/SmtB family transcription factor [Clostridiales bacterium]
MEEKAKKIAEMLRLLANENRLLILCALIRGPLTVSNIAEFVPNITASALSQHLTLLKTAGILESDKHAQNVTYSVADARVAEVIATLKKYYC